MERKMQGKTDGYSTSHQRLRLPYCCYSGSALHDLFYLELYNHKNKDSIGRNSKDSGRLNRPYQTPGQRYYQTTTEIRYCDRVKGKDEIR